MEQGIKIKDIKNLEKYKQFFQNKTQSALLFGETKILNGTSLNVSTLLDFINWLINDIIEKQTCMTCKLHGDYGGCPLDDRIINDKEWPHDKFCCTNYDEKDN